MLTYDDFKAIRTRHVPSLFVEAHKFVSYKNISIHEAMHEISFRGDWCQFGVFKGQTARILESFVMPDQKLHLFDSFEGLPEAWTNTAFGKGHFAVGEAGIPRFDPARTVVHKGWFADTVPVYARESDKPLPFLHLDADLYSSTMTVLEALNHRIVRGTLLLFDELFLPTPQGLSDDECRALFDWSAKYGRRFQILWRTEWVQCAVRVIH